MRIITGKYKGRTLVAPKESTRPTLDRAKETLFNILNDSIEDAVVLDLFAGSGQLALECLSRGAAAAYLCDTDREAQKAIFANFQKVGEKPQLFQCDWAACLKRLSGAQVDLVFVDPPYKSGLYVAVLKKLQTENVIAENGMVVCEHASEDALPQDVLDLHICDSRKIGTVTFSFYRKSEDQ